MGVSTHVIMLEMILRPRLNHAKKTLTKIEPFKFLSCKNKLEENEPFIFL